MNDPDYRKQELERLLSNALMVHVDSGSGVTDKDIQKDARALQSLFSPPVPLDNAMTFTEIMKGFSSNHVYLFFKTPDEEEKFVHLYNELYAAPALAALKKKLPPSVEFHPSATGKPLTFRLVWHTVTAISSLGAARSENMAPLEEVERSVGIDPTPIEPGQDIGVLGSYVRISNTAGDHTAADAFFGEFTDKVKAFHKVSDSDSWISSVLPIVTAFRNDSKDKPR